MSCKGHILEWAANESLVSITRSEKELTIVCDEKLVLNDCEKNRDWKCIKIVGSFELDAVGVIASVSVPLAENQIGPSIVQNLLKVA